MMYNNPPTYHGRDILKTNYQDHHELKIRNQGSRSFLNSFLNGNDIDLRDKSLPLVCLVAKATAFKCLECK